jgi:NAD(P)-dependent dehydrogenase (short-subunit alcohol dehydrogenase family)
MKRQAKMLDLAGKTAIITGGGTGIGREIATALAKEGVKVVVCGRRDASLDRVVQEILVAGGQALGVQADVSQERDVDRVVSSAKDVFGNVDFLINNAGIGGGGAIHTHSVDEWDQIMAVNLRGPFLMCRAVLSMMRSKRSGHILNISSESGLEYYPEDGAYGVAKHALNVLGEYIQRENQELGIRVDTICPGMVITEMTEGYKGLDHTKCLYPADIADLVLWLLTRRSNIKIGRPVLIQTMKNPWE